MSKKLAFKMDITREECDDPYHGVTFLFILSPYTEYMISSKVEIK